MWTIKANGNQTISEREFDALTVRMTFVEVDGQYRFRGHVLVEGDPVGNFVVGDLFAAQDRVNDLMAGADRGNALVMATTLARNMHKSV